jgi:uncharacterized MAPEG superfamily protein
MTTIECLSFDPAANRMPPPRPIRAKPYPVLDAGAIAVLMLLLGLFVLPMVLWAMNGTAASRAGAVFELRALAWAALLATVWPVLQVLVQIRRFGGATIRGNRDRFAAADGFSGRIARAHANLVESLMPFAASVLVAHGLQVSNRWTVAASALNVAARLVHATSYALGVTIIRSSAFYAGVIATVIIACQVLMALS